MCQPNFTTQINISINGELYRLVWFKETSGKNPGIRTGYFSKKVQGVHHSYYTNGYSHSEINIKGKSLLMNSSMRTPFQYIDHPFQLGFQTFPIGDDVNMLASKKETTIVADKIITLTSGQIETNLSIDLSIVKIGNEDEYLELIKKFHIKQPNNRKLILVELIPLQNFLSHRIGLALFTDVS